MRTSLKAIIYYVVGSAAAGVVMGAAFATNLGGRAGKAELESLQKLGVYTPLNLENIDGGLIAMPHEPRPTVIYVHGRSANRMEMAPLAEALFKQGYNAVLWDSRSRQISYGPREIDDISRIVASVRADPRVRADRIYVIGFSLGGAMAIGAAAADTAGYIKGIVADSPYAELKTVASRYMTAFGVIPAPFVWLARTVTFKTADAMHGIDFQNRNPADWASRVSCPVLLIHGKSDRRIPPGHSERILDGLSTDKDLWLVDGAGHTESFEKNKNEYIRRVLGFLSR